MKKKIWIVSLFPEYFFPLLECGVVGQALRGERSTGRVEFEVITVNPRDFSFNRYKSVDDYPFGGGPGMIMRADVLENTFLKGIIEAGGYHQDNWASQLKVIYPSPRGRIWNHSYCLEFAQKSLSVDSSPSKDLVFICGRYEGVDERFLEVYVEEYISVGDYILSGGELAVMAILDAALRFTPGVLGNKLSDKDESFGDGLIEYPQYTRPRIFAGKPIPDELLSGHHKKITDFKARKKLEMTKKYRPDLLEKTE